MSKSEPESSGPIFIDCFLSLIDQVKLREKLSDNYLERVLELRPGYFNRVEKRELYPGELYPDSTFSALARLLYRCPGLAVQLDRIQTGTADPNWKPL